MLDLFCGRFGWGKAFAARGWEVVGGAETPCVAGDWRKKMQYVIFAGSASDGKVYHMRICDCGHQNTAGICEHVKEPIIVEQMPQQFSTTPTIPHSIGR